MFYLIIAQIIIAIALSISILLQQRGTALGSAFGGSGESYLTRRGAEKKIFGITVVLAVLLIVLSVLNLVV